MTLNLKRISVFCSVVLLLVGILAVPAFARPIDALPANCGFHVNNGSVNINSFLTSNIVPEEKAFLTEWYANLSGLSSDYEAFSCFSNSPSPSICFILAPLNSIASLESDSGSPWIYFRSSSGSLRYVKFSYNVSQYVTVGSISTSPFVGFKCSSSAFVISATNRPNLEVPIISPENVIYNDDGGIFKNPEPPSSSEPTKPPKPPYVPPEPVIPAGNTEFVPYDTSVWKTFLNHVRGNIGSATNIGFLIFAILFSWFIAIRIVHVFSRSK